MNTHSASLEEKGLRRQNLARFSMRKKFSAWRHIPPMCALEWVLEPSRYTKYYLAAVTGVSAVQTVANRPGAAYIYSLRHQVRHHVI